MGYIDGSRSYGDQSTCCLLTIPGDAAMGLGVSGQRNEDTGSHQVSREGTIGTVLAKDASFYNSGGPLFEKFEERSPTLSGIRLQVSGRLLASWVIWAVVEDGASNELVAYSIIAYYSQASSREGHARNRESPAKKDRNPVRLGMHRSVPSERHRRPSRSDPLSRSRVHPG